MELCAWSSEVVHDVMVRTARVLQLGLRLGLETGNGYFFSFLILK